MCFQCGEPHQQRVLLPDHPIDLHRLGGIPNAPPDLGSVRADIAKIPDAEKTVSSYSDPAPADSINSRVFRPAGKMVLHGSVPRSVLLYALLPILFKYSFLIDTNDVPKDIAPSVIWALETLGRLIDESSDHQFAAMICGPWSHGSGVKLNYSKAHIRKRACDVRPYFGRITRMKAAALLLTPWIERPSEALWHLKQAAKYVSAAAACNAGILTYDLLMLTGEALARSGEDDETAEKLLRELADPSNVEDDAIQHLITSKTFLARVLRRRGKVNAAKKHEKWLTNWFRKTGHMFSVVLLQMLLMPPGESVSPILEALGGPSWLLSGEMDDEQERRFNRYCFRCAGREPMVELSLCSRCKKIYYCSRECQKEDRTLHNAIVENNERIEQLSQTNPAAAQKEKDWQAWLKSGSSSPYVDALRLHEDPRRARTHAVVEESVYTPNAGPRAADKFKIVKCSVFSMSAVLAKLEGLMGLDPGEGAMLLGPEDSEENTDIRYFIHRICAGMDPTMLGNGWVRKDYLKHWQYDPNWRQKINKDVPPIPLELAPGIRDAEFD
ncbi:hypothetical protein FOMPIDRAFT_92538 [Fomitopsis schrenkii]|uniref:MYND-type domain-containing protein n=1 Tax=Fomitopsis schrenkii TaxID=2126942 RepID=S8E0Q5_FOMSC|nr:hypothetical protein FOMPIDRAFT_92538 [Fomitopsis schrenkii]